MSVLSTNQLMKFGDNKDLICINTAYGDANLKFQWLYGEIICFDYVCTNIYHYNTDTQYNYNPLYMYLKNHKGKTMFTYVIESKTLYLL